MSDEGALHLSEIDPPQWRVLVNGSVYGPYTLGQMQAFVRERRIGAASKVSAGEDGAFGPAAEHEPLRLMFETGHAGNREAPGTPANYLIIARLTGTGEMQFMAALNRLGRFAEVMSGVWALRSTVHQARIRDRLQATIVSGDQVMIANATSGRLAWLNLGPEADIHIRQVWDADLDQSA